MPNLLTERGVVTNPEPKRADRERALREITLENIGRPDDLDRVDIRQLQSPNHYRVNVYRFVKGVSKITDSFYISITSDGPMSSPPMVRRYWGDVLDAYSTPR